jgi:cell division protein FtsL
MSNPGTSSDAAPVSSRKRPWGLIAAIGVLAAGLVAVGIYAISLNSDLDDANAKVASQQAQIRSQQKEIEEAQSTGADVVAAATTAYEDLRSRLGAAQQDAGQASEQAAAKLDQAEKAVAAAQGSADEVQKEVDAAQAKAEAAAVCAQSFLTAFRGVFSAATLEAGVEAAVAELEALQPKCAQALGQGDAGQ